MSGVALRRVESMAGVRVAASRSVEVLTPAHLQIDGEYVGRGPATIEIVPGALSLLVPPTYEALRRLVRFGPVIHG
jgi:diacylglycerol kinase family enzyme